MIEVNHAARAATYRHLGEIIKMLKRIQKRKHSRVLFWMARFVDEIRSENSLGFKAVGHCGTTCCALGHMGLTKYFQNLGIVTNLRTMHITFSGNWASIDTYCQLAAKRLGITWEESTSIFLPTRYMVDDNFVTDEVTIEMVIDRVSSIRERYQPKEEVPCPSAMDAKPS